MYRQPRQRRDYSLPTWQQRFAITRKERENDLKRKTVGFYSALALLLFVVSLTVIGRVDYLGLLSNFLEFIRGNLDNVESGKNESVIDKFLVILTFNAVDIMLVLFLAMVVLKKNEAHKGYEELFQKGPFALFRLVLIEELFARWLFLGVLTHVFEGTFAFYVLMLLGNSLWALIHILNYQNPSQVSVKVVLPQFVGGILLSYIFVRYGLLVAIVMHYTYNLMIFTLFKKQLSEKNKYLKSVLFLGATVVVLGLLVWSENTHISVFSMWTYEKIDRLPNFTFWDYALPLLMLQAVTMLIAEALCLDKFTYEEKDRWLKIVDEHWTTLIWYPLLNVAVTLLLFWLLSFFTQNDVTRVIILVLVSASSQARSGSSFVRAGLLTLPYGFFAIAAYVTLDFWSAYFLAMLLSSQSLLFRLYNKHFIEA